MRLYVATASASAIVIADTDRLAEINSVDCSPGGFET